MHNGFLWRVCWSKGACFRWGGGYSQLGRGALSSAQRPLFFNHETKSVGRTDVTGARYGHTCGTRACTRACTGAGSLPTGIQGGIYREVHIQGGIPGYTPPRVPTQGGILRREALCLPRNEGNLCAERLPASLGRREKRLKTGPGP